MIFFIIQLIGGPPNPSQDSSENLVSIFISKVIDPENPYGTSDSVRILLLQFAALLVEKAAPHIHDAADKWVLVEDMVTKVYMIYVTFSYRLRVWAPDRDVRVQILSWFQCFLLPKFMLFLLFSAPNWHFYFDFALFFSVFSNFQSFLSVASHIPGASSMANILYLW